MKKHSFGEQITLKIPGNGEEKLYNTERRRSDSVLIPAGWFIDLSDCDGLGGVARLGPKGAPPAAHGQVQPGACPQPAAQRVEDVQELASELHTHKGVQDGVEAAVEVTDGSGDHPGLVQGGLCPAGLVAAAGMKRVRHERDVVRRPADEEHDYHGHDHPDGFLLLEALQAALQPVQDARVAEDQDGRRKQEAHNVVEQPRRPLPVGYHLRPSSAEIEVALRRGGELKVVGSALCFVASHVLQGLQEDPIGDGEQQGEKPHSKAADVNHPGVPAGVHLGGVDDGHVAVQADADQQENAAVKIDLRAHGAKINEGRRTIFQPRPWCNLPATHTYHEGGAGDLAQRGSKAPSQRFSSLRGPKRQSKQQQEVGHAQVKDKGVGHTPPLPALSQDSQQHPVSHHTDNTGHGVQQRDKRGLKGESLFLVAYFSPVATIQISVVCVV